MNPQLTTIPIEHAILKAAMKLCVCCKNPKHWNPAEDAPVVGWVHRKRIDASQIHFCLATPIHALQAENKRLVSEIERLNSSRPRPKLAEV